MAYSAPAVNKRLSPGKKKPIKSPDSAKITTRTAKMPRVIIISTRSNPGIAPSMVRFEISESISKALVVIYKYFL